MATFDAADYEGVDLLDVGGVEDTNPQIPRNRPPSPLNTERICYLVPHSISGDRKRLSEAIERVYIGRRSGPARNDSFDSRGRERTRRLR